MSLFLESMSFVENRFPLLEYHLFRMRKTAEIMGWESPPEPCPHLIPPEIPGHQKYKVRLTYGKTIEHTEWIPYQKMSPERILLIQNDQVNYSLKFAERRFFDSLKNRYPLYDDFIIVKNGLITDSTYCNILVRIKGDWISPVQPLLPGVQRQFLLDQGKIKTGAITVRMLLNEAEEIRLINALMPMEDCIELNSENIFTEFNQ